MSRRLAAACCPLPGLLSSRSKAHLGTAAAAGLNRARWPLQALMRLNSGLGRWFARPASQTASQSGQLAVPTEELVHGGPASDCPDAVPSGGRVQEWLRKQAGLDEEEKW